MGWECDCRACGLDRICLRFLAAAGLLAGSVCGGAGWELFRVSGRCTPETRDSSPVAGGAGGGGFGVLFSDADAGDHAAVDYSDCAAVLFAARGRDAAAGAEAGVGAAVQDAAVSATAADCDGWICVHAGEPQ